MSYLTQLKTFVEVYRCGNITKAAVTLGMSQPAVTAHIQVIESLMGKTLFVRKARGVEPTPLANDLMLQVAAHIDQIEQRIESVRSRSQAVFGTLNVAGPAEYLSFMAGPQFANLLKSGEVNLVVHVGNKNRIYELLQSGVADLAITASLPDPAGYDYQIIDSETLLLVMHQQMATQFDAAAIDYQQLCQLPVVSYDHDLPLIRRYFELIYNQPCKSTVAAVIPDIRAIAAVVNAGVGYSVLPDYLYRDKLRFPHLVQVGAAGPENHIYLVWRKGALKQARIAFAKDMMMMHANLNRHSTGASTGEYAPPLLR